MSELTDMTDVTGQPETTQTMQTTDERSSDGRDARDPLWMPRGSVRAAIALGVIAVWALLETGVLGPVGASDSVRTMAIAVAGAYGVLRAQERRGAEGAGE